MDAITINDKVKFGSILLNVILIAVVIALLRGCNCPPCYEAGQKVVKIDTIRPKDITPKVISVKVPVPVKSIAKKKFAQDVSSKTEPTLLPLSPVVSVSTEAPVPPAGASASPCDTINIYRDTIHRADTCTIIINDTLEDNHIAGRSVLYVDLRPEIRTTITDVKRDKWKFYIGGAFTYNARYGDRWGAGPEVLLTIPKVGGISYIYDVKNNSHTAGVMALLRFKK